MIIEKMWLVTKPTELSKMPDICFPVDTEGLAHALAGGLRSIDLLAICTEEAEAREIASKLLVARDAFIKVMRAAVRS